MTTRHPSTSTVEPALEATRPHRPASSRGLRRLCEAVARHAGGRLAAALGLAFAGPFVDAATVGLAVHVLAIAGFDIGPTSRLGHFAGTVVAGLAAIGLSASLTSVFALLLAFMGVRSVIGALQRHAATSAGLVVEDALRARLYRAFAAANWLFITRSRSSDLLNGLTSELRRVTLAISTLITSFDHLLLAVTYLAVGLLVSLRMTCLMAAACALIAFLLRRKTRALRRTGMTIVARTNAVYAAATEHLQNLKAVKTYGAESRDAETFARLSRALAADGIGVASQQLTAGVWFEVGSVVVLGGSILAALHWEMVRPAELVVLIGLFTRVLPRLSLAYNGINSVHEALAPFEHVTTLEADFLAAADRAGGAEERRAPLTMRRDLRLEGVVLRYERDGRCALDGVDLVVPASGCTAIFGVSGAGKSSIADIVTGLVAPDTGRVLVDGVPLEGEDRVAWRRRVGYVGSDTMLFHDTIRANLLWARPDASESDVAEALRLAAADEFVGRLPRGLDTIVGDRGIRLSQGERQRIALARALVRRPALLVLDEATSGLDSENERRVLEAVERLQQQLTVLIISHRVSTIRHAGTIHLVEAGRVVESGSWASLAGDPRSRFRAICVLQGIVVA